MATLANVDCADLKPVQGTRLLLDLDLQGSKVLDWAQENRAHVERLVQGNGALLIRGLKFVGSQQFGAVLSTLFGEDLMQYTYRSTPRTELRGNVYTATEYHPDQVIPQHNENSYSNRWAMRIGFLCTVPSPVGGSTPICDSRLVYREIPEAIRARFERHGVMYVRNYSEIDIPWTEVFQTTEKADVESFCIANQLSYEWLGERHLRTRQINQASAQHPVTGARVWFNQAHLFHVTNLEADVQESLLSVMKEEHLPRNTYYGNGDHIEPETLQTIRDIYDRNKIAFDWQRNDLLLLDNMLYSHGRGTYSGNRQVLVGMTRLHGSEAAAIAA
ncbi:alpha-ketoglutarate-dependent taurine dioxygenase [Tahibacter aquaticus]|uniref:Alpha-ketoglutarate-dependent taurine dioxygenase n=1 Tax=Tahibacter aquaticus TaxID=520092 RepID=A0A4V6PYE5_9GAMM|nr:TauD/TfdA family dioxygenase [Tahibacter aquaticus]TDR45086.1 alpha-ketoglutarate-dependent taurine dioxygenase [Tahibacter aquaticus]